MAFTARFRADGLRGVFDHGNVVPFSDLKNGIHMRHVSIKVNRNYGFRSRRNALFK